MELRRVSEALLRSQTSPLSNLILPSTTKRWPATRQSTCYAVPAHRTFTSSSKNYLERPVTTTSSTPQPSLSASQPRTLGNSRPRQNSDILDGLSTGLGWTKPSALEKKGRGRSSAAELLDKLAAKQSAAVLESTRFTFGGAMDFPDLKTSNVDMKGIAGDMNSNHTKPNIPMRLNPAAGRTVQVSPNLDLTRAIRKMEMLVGRNSVRRDFNTQRYHERGGLKRKRLRRERWRKNFKASFTATVARVHELKKQGW